MKLKLYILLCELKFKRLEDYDPIKVKKEGLKKILFYAKGGMMVIINFCWNEVNKNNKNDVMWNILLEIFNKDILI